MFCAVPTNYASHGPRALWQTPHKHIYINGLPDPSLLSLGGFCAQNRGSFRAGSDEVGGENRSSYFPVSTKCGMCSLSAKRQGEGGPYV